MAKRNFVKDLEAVKEFNEQIDKSNELLNSLTGAGKNLGEQLMMNATTMGLSGKYSQENLDKAKQQSKAGKDILNVLDQQNKGNALGVVLGKAKLKWNRMFSNKSDEVTQGLYEQYDIQQKQRKEQKKFKEGAADLLDSLKGQLPFGKEMGILFGKQAKATAVIAATIKIVTSIMTAFAARTKVIGKEFGAIGMMNKEFKNDMLEASTNARKLGFDTKDVAEVMRELTTNFGVGRDEALDMANKIMDTSVALGLSNQEGAKLIGTLMEVAGLSEDAAHQFSKQVSLLAQAEGAAPTAVLRDLAQSSETIAKFTGLTPDNLAKAAIQANKLGLQIKDIADTAEGLLNFQDSLNKEIEASILLGRQVNLQKARELALSGDLEGLAVEITKQVGSEAEWNQMNVLQRQALAGAIGMSVEKLGKVISNQDKIKGINDEIAEQKSFEELVGREGLDNITKIMNDFKAIGADLVNTIGPAISWIVGGIADFTKYLSESPNLLAGIGAMLATMAVNSLISAISWIWQTFAKIPFGFGIPLAIGATVGLMAKVASAKSASAEKGGITTQEGMVNLHPQEAIIPLNKLDNIMRRKDDDSTMRKVGTMIASAMKPIAEENRRMREQNEILILETRRIGTRTADALAEIA